MRTHGEPPGENRTGTALAPERAAEMIAATGEFPPSSHGDSRAIAAVRVQYAAEDPAPAAPEDPAAVLLDKLGERLAYERAGVRLYEALLSKLEAYANGDGAPSREDLERVLTEEDEHFHLLRAQIEARGGDPTELTRSASVQLTASSGVSALLADPRATFAESLQGVLVAELTDNDSWEALADLARVAGDEELAAQCEEALLTEQEHLEKVRGWLAAAQGRPAPPALEVEVELDAETGAGKAGAAKRRKPPGQGARGARKAGARSRRSR